MLIVLVPFSKYSGCGNDFIVIDNRRGVFPAEMPGLIAHLCHRRNGIGADGILLLENGLDYRMRIFNSDGSEAEMCGNGIRCLMHFIHNRENKSHCRIETQVSSVFLKFHENRITASMPIPRNIKIGITLPVNEKLITADFLDTGVPHLVLKVEDLEDHEHMTMAPFLRSHPLLAPHGANVNFACLGDDGSVRVRTYERGVEGETLSCGTGATAAALSLANRFGLTSPVKVFPRSGEMLEVGFHLNSSTIENVTMTGPATHLFDGSIDLAKFHSAYATI